MEARTVFENIDFAYGSNRILFNTAISLPISGIVGIYGRNGSGKSTLFACMMGMNNCPSLRVTHLEETLTVAAYRKPQFINLLGQGLTTLGFLTIKQCLDLYGIEVEAIPGWPSFAKDLNQKMYVMSSGQRRLVENLLLIYSKSAITLLDEPFTGLMPLNQEYIVEAIERQKSTKTLVISDHKVDLVFDTCDRHYLLKDGRLNPIELKSDLRLGGYLP